jgi:molybdate transport system ATP-binding protein
MKLKLAELSAVSVKSGSNPILTNVTLTIHQHEQWAILGSSGSGKTSLANVLAGKVFHSGILNYFFADAGKTHIELVEQQHHFKNLSNTSLFYYQQRFNAADAEDSITVKEVLTGYPVDQNWIELLQLTDVLQKPLIQLSNGENKRLQLAKALLPNPALLILDNPFTGLDAEGRITLHAIIDLITSRGIHIILITNPYELPASITHIAVLEKGRLVSSGKKEDYRPQEFMPPQPSRLLNSEQLQHVQQPQQEDFSIAVKMEHVNICYGEKIILHNINWEVKKAECWAVSGPNGAGKSTLLSLITADNPQAYANKIILFDKQRGSGESIWDIKKRIGFVSPELHLFFEQSASCLEVIASGLFDTIGLFRRLSEEQEQKVLLWIQLLQLEPFQNRLIGQLSTGQQRMVLLARALVKNPPLLILDEPCQGLDNAQSVYFKQLINELCAAFNTTLIYVSHYNKDIPGCIQHFMQLKNGTIQ